jgi:DNA-damage-inducible protein J
MENVMTNVNVRTNAELKAKATALFAKMGMDMTTAINAFLEEAVREKGIPFDITYVNPGRRKKYKSIRGIKEGQWVLRDDFNDSSEDLFNAFNGEEDYL